MAGPAVGADRHHRKPAEGRGLAARGTSRGRRGRPLAPGQPPGPGRRRSAAAVFDAARGAGRRPQRQGPHRGLRPRSARQRGAAAPADRVAAGDGARLLALPRGRNPLPAPVRDHRRGGADRRRLDAEGAGGQPRGAHAVRHPPRPAGGRAAVDLVRAAACRAAAEPGGRGSHRRSPGRLARATGRRRRRGVGVGLGLPPGRCRVRAGAPGAAARRSARGAPAQRRLVAPGRRDRRRRDAAGLSAQLARRPGVLRCRRARADGQPCLRRAGPAQRRGAGARPGAGPLDRPHRRRARAC